MNKINIINETSYQEAERLIEHARAAREKQLDLSSLRIADLPASLGQLHWLESLDLSNCYWLEELSVLEKLSGLQTLGLSGCDRLAHLDPLENLIRLSTLKISRIAHASWLYHFPRLVTVENYFSNLVIDNVPVELLSNAGNALVPITAWQQDLLASGSAPDSELKLFILGNGGIGKTQITRRLHGLGYDPAVPSTHGISLGRFKILDASDGDPDMFLNVWDFGGQDIYLSTHGLFLDERAIYVVAWHPAFENQEEYEENGIPMRNRLLGYWLAYIHSLAGANAPVIVAQTQCDEADGELAAPLPDDHGFHYLKTTACSALQDYGLERLLPEIRQAARLLRKRYAAVEIPESWVDLEQELRELRNGGQKTLSFESFSQQCHRRHQLAPPALIAEFLHRAGQVFWRQGVFGNDLVLQQEWALAGIYAVLERNKVLPYIRSKGGVFDLTQLQNSVWQDFNEQEQRMFLDMMVQCGACFALGDDTYMATELLPDERDVAQAVQSIWRNAKADAHAVLSYDFLHDGIVKQVLRHIGDKAKLNGKYWRTGVCYYDCEAESAVKIRAMFEPEQHYGQRGQLEVLAAGKQAQQLAEHLIQSIESIRIGGKAQIEWRCGSPAPQAQDTEKKDAAELPFAAVTPAAWPDSGGVPVTVSASQQNILVFATEWDSHHGGLSTFNRELCMALAQLGKTVYCAVERASRDEVERAKANKVLLISAPDGKLVRKLPLPSDFRPDIIVGHGRITGGPAKAQQEDFYPQAKRTHFIHMSPHLIEWHKGKADAAQQAEARGEEELSLAKEAQLVVAVGPMLFGEANTLADRLEHSLRPKICQFNPGFRRRDNEKKSKPHNLQCLLVGRAEDEALKGIDIAVQALHQIVEKEREPLEYKPELIIRGAPEGKGTALNRQIKDKHQGFQVQVKEYSGDQEAITGDYRSAALFLMPSRSEGFGLVALKALSVGTPVLISRNSGLAELLKSYLQDHELKHYIVDTPANNEDAVSNWVQSIKLQLSDIEAAIHRAGRLADTLEQKLKWTDSCRKMLDELC